MADRTSGAAGVSDDLGPAVEVLAPEPVQLSLLEALEARRIRPAGTMGALRPAPDDDGEGEAPATDAAGRRGPGRPPGARNKSTEAVRRYIFATYGNPLVNAARFAAADPVELARYLGCEPREALQLILLAVRVVSEYVNSKMPATVRLDGKGAVAFGVFGQAAPAGETIVTGAADPMAALLAFASGETVENQGDSSAPAGMSNAAPANEAPETPAASTD